MWRRIVIKLKGKHSINIIEIKWGHSSNTFGQNQNKPLLMLKWYTIVRYILNIKCKRTVLYWGSTDG